MRFFLTCYCFKGCNATVSSKSLAIVTQERVGKDILTQKKFTEFLELSKTFEDRRLSKFYNLACLDLSTSHPLRLLVFCLRLWVLKLAQENSEINLLNSS